MKPKTKENGEKYPEAIKIGEGNYRLKNEGKKLKP